MFRRRIGDRLGAVSRIGAGRGAGTKPAPACSPTGPPTTTDCRVLIISGSVGAGHDGAARELARRLEAQGHHVELRDFLNAAPIKLGAAMKSSYEFELKHLAWLYDLTYWLCYRLLLLYPLVVWLVTSLTARRLRRWVCASGAEVVVSTYPLATLALGWLRRHHRLDVPAVNFITDFGVHPLWVHRGIDLNLAVHHQPAEVVARRAGGTALACGPVVSERFAQLPPRDLARQQLGLSPEERAVLVVAGSWGVGGLHHTLKTIAGSGRFVPVVVCGRDVALASSLQRLAGQLGSRAIILGWTDQMPALMSAADVLVENAGGLTSLEAFRSGLPVVSFRPIAGHGRANTKAMAAAGVSRLARSAADLLHALETLCQPTAARAAQVLAAQRMFYEDATSQILRAATGGLDWARTRRRRPAAVAMRLAATCTASLGLIWAVATFGVGAAAAASGVGALHPSAQAGAVAYLGVRLNAAELASSTIRSQLSHLDATAVIDSATASADPQAIQVLAGQQVDVANGGIGPDPTERRAPRPKVSLATPWGRALRSVKTGSTLGHLVGQPVTLFVPRGSVTAFELVDCYERHNHLVLANSVLSPAQRRLGALTARRIYLVNGLHTSPRQLEAFLARLGHRLAQEGLLPAPLDALA